MARCQVSFCCMIHCCRLTNTQITKLVNVPKATACSPYVSVEIFSQAFRTCTASVCRVPSAPAVWYKSTEKRESMRNLRWVDNFTYTYVTFSTFHGHQPVVYICAAISFFCVKSLLCDHSMHFQQCAFVGIVSCLCCECSCYASSHCADTHTLPSSYLLVESTITSMWIKELEWLSSTVIYSND